MNSAVLFIFAALLSRLADHKQDTELYLRCAFEKKPKNVHLLLMYAKSRGRLGRPWQRLETLENYKSHFNNSLRYCLALGSLQMSMYRLSQAKSTLERAVAISQRSSQAWWLLGQVLEDLGDVQGSRAAFTQAVACSWSTAARRWGVGIWFAKAGRWQKAVQAYTSQLETTPAHRQASLLIHRAKAHEKLLDWQQASHDYEKVLQLEPGHAAVQQHLAWAYAHSGHWQQAQLACQKALELNCFRLLGRRMQLQCLLALCLHKQGLVREAAEQFALAHHVALQRPHALWHRSIRKSLARKDKAHAQQAYAYVELALKAWAERNWQQAAVCWAQVVQRWPVHAPPVWIALGHSLVAVGQWQLACRAFECASLYRWPMDYAQQKLQRKRAQRLVMEYTEYLETLELDPHMVLYESYAGVSISCSPYAMYRAIVDAPEFVGWTHVWVLNDLSRIPANCAGRSNVVFVARDSQLYRRYLATAGWLVNNSTFPSYFIRREGQKYLNTWHGTPLKTLGKDIRGNFMEHKNTARNLLHATHIISPNQHTSHVLLERNDIAGLYQGQLAQTGYPRNDLVTQASALDKVHFRQKLGFLAETGQPLVLYAPTWRGILGHPEIDAQQLIGDLQVLRKQNCQIVFRGHYFAEKALVEAGLSNIHVAPQAIDTSELLAITDVLITDYSSIFFDFLPTGRPILFYTYDLEQYRQERGLYFDMADMPGTNCASVQQLSAELGDVLIQIGQGSWQPDARYRAAQEKFSPNEDGQATQRAIEFFFKNKHPIVLQPKPDGRKTLLFFVGPFTPMGITTAAINLISALDPQQYCVIVAIDPDAVGSHPERMERLSRLPAHVHILGRVGLQVCSAQERSVIDEFHRHDRLEPQQWTVYAKAFQREFRRVFGDWQPSHVINYDGYARFWAGLLAFGPQPGKQRLVYLHNDMHGEWQVRFPHLAGMFGLYPHYDLLVSVAKAISDANRKNLAQPFGIGPERFVHIDNIPDFAEVRAKAQEPLESDLAQWLAPTPPGQVFVSIGRLSPEKNHALLLNAFAKLLKNYPQARLVILGDGILRKELERQIAEKGLGAAVLLPGVRSNPFPLLFRCDCFVLPSKHEGQPMVLLEAMALEKSIIATNIPGVRELLMKGYGKIVNNDADDLANALMNELEDPEKKIGKIDFFEYKNKILKKFEEILKG